MARDSADRQQRLEDVLAIGSWHKTIAPDHGQHLEELLSNPTEIPPIARQV